MPLQAQAVLNGIPVVVLRYDRDVRIRFANRCAARVFGQPAEQLVGRTLAELLGQCPELSLHLRELDGVFASGLEASYESHESGPQENAWFQILLTPEFDADGRVVSVLSVATDITRLKATQEQASKAEQRFQAFFKHLPAVAWIKGSDGRYQFVSRAMEVRFGAATQWLGRTDAEMLPPEVVAVVGEHDRQVRATRQPMEVQEDVPTADGIVQTWQVVKFPIVHDDGTVSTGGIAMDTSVQRKLEEEKRLAERRLYEAVKLESLGVLAGGIAHDFNNLLTSIVGFNSLAHMELAAGRVAAAPDYLTQADTAAGRAADLCKQMLAYAGKGQFVVRPVSLTQLVEEMAQLLQAAISKKAVLRLMLTRDIPAVECDATQIRQVVMNLITNASDAIGDRSGVITVSTGVIDADAKYLADIEAHELPPTRYVYTEVSDTGVGMDDATKAKIFEPFFTTKFTGRGLGLAAAQGIVRAHKGAMKVYTAPGRGTTFKVLLPATTAQPHPETMTPAAPMAGGGRLVLVVDDEEDIRVFARKALELAGFRAVVAADGREAVEVFRAHAAEIAAVVCDLTMPHMDGATAFRQIRQLAPTAKVILTSGFSEDEATAGLAGKGLAAFLRKPFRAHELLRAVTAVLEGPPN